MQRWKSILALLVLAFWMPCTARCELAKSFEKVPECCESNSHKSPDTDAGTCVCDAVASGGYHFSNSKMVVSAPVLIYALADLFGHNFSLDEKSAPELIHSPQEIRTQTVWHFISRAALPVRAPSIAS